MGHQFKNYKGVEQKLGHAGRFLWSEQGVCTGFLSTVCQIDQLVDATLGHKMLSFMDNYPSCNQIRMHPYDEMCITLYVNDDMLCYKFMPFRLINARGW